VAPEEKRKKKEKKRTTNSRPSKIRGRGGEEGGALPLRAFQMASSRGEKRKKTDQNKVEEKKLPGPPRGEKGKRIRRPCLLGAREKGKKRGAPDVDQFSLRRRRGSVAGCSMGGKKKEEKPWGQRSKSPGEGRLPLPQEPLKEKRGRKVLSKPQGSSSNEGPSFP